MSDEIIGTAILDTAQFLQHRLAVICHSANGTKREQILPVYPRGAARPNLKAAWEYAVVGDLLEVSPSVHLLHQVPDEGWVTDFHNGASWRVRFKLSSGGVSTSEGSYLYRELREANP